MVNLRRVEECRRLQGFDGTMPLKTYRQRMALVASQQQDRHLRVISISLPWCCPLLPGHHVHCLVPTAACWPALFAVLTSIQGNLHVRLRLATFQPRGGGGLDESRAVHWLDPGRPSRRISQRQVLLYGLSKRNGGIYEAEMRLWMAVPMAVVTPTGTSLVWHGLGSCTSWLFFFFFFFLVPSNLYPDFMADKILA